MEDFLKIVRIAGIAKNCRNLKTQPQTIGILHYRFSTISKTSFPLFLISSVFKGSLFVHRNQSKMLK